MGTTQSKSPPMQEGLFTIDAAGEYRLVASHCAACNLTFFPKRRFCGRCGSTAVTERLLSRSGTVHAFSVIDRKSKFAMIEPPYVQAEVTTPEGVSVFTVLDGCNPADVRIGMPVELYVGAIAGGDKGELTTYKYRPAAGAETSRKSNGSDCHE